VQKRSFVKNKVIRLSKSWRSHGVLESREKKLLLLRGVGVAAKLRFAFLFADRSAELRRASRGSQLSLMLADIGAEHAVAPDDDAVLVHFVVD
jgi:hypothetical protein